MDDIGKWENPNNFLSAFRCTTVENAQKFVENGEIKFNTPNLWVQLAIENGEGRGDRLEGTMATFHESDIPHLKQISLKYENHPGLIRMPLGKRMYLKNERSMSLPCFCFYMLKIDMFECPNVEGNHRLTTLVPPSYFRDFMNNLEPEQVGELPLKDRPAIIIIHNYKEFEKRLMKALIDLGRRKRN